MKIKVLGTGITHTFDQPVYNITIVNTGRVQIFIGGDTKEDSITLHPNARKSIGFAGIKEIYFTTEDGTTGEIDVTGIEFLKPIFRGPLGVDQELLDLGAVAHGITVKNLSGNDFYISINKKINGDVDQSYKIKENEFIQIEQNIEKVWLMSEGDSVYELYAYRKPGRPMQY